MSTPHPSLYASFLISFCLHLIFLYPWAAPHKVEKIKTPIPVALIAAPQPKVETPHVEQSEKSQDKRQIETVPKRPAETIVPKSVKTQKDLARGTAHAPPSRGLNKQAALPESRPLPHADDGGPHPQLVERKSIVRPTLPSLSELLPPLDLSELQSESAADQEAIQLGSTDPNYSSYLETIKRAIERLWVYPSSARAHGIQGTLRVEFTVTASGNLSELKLIRSSGFLILDEEALRAIRSAAPFHPIPRWIDKRQIPIIAAFEYSHHRRRYTSPAAVQP